MKCFALLLLSACCAFGQLTMQQMQPFFKGSGSSADTRPAPVAMNGARYYWCYTNNLQSTFVTNWVDQISSLAFKWNTTKVANTRPTNSVTGVYFDGFNIGQFLTNSPIQASGDRVWSNLWLYISFKPNNFAYNPIYIWGDSGSAHQYLDSSTAKIITFANSAGGVVNLTTALAALTEYDMSMCVSNGLLWSWTNGIASKVAIAFPSGNSDWLQPIGLGGPISGANYYDGYIQELALGTNGFNGTYFTGSDATTLHNWRTNVILFSTP